MGHNPKGRKTYLPKKKPKPKRPSKGKKTK